MSDSTIHIGRVSGVQANYNYDPVDQEDTMKIQSNMYINNPNMTSRNIEKKENGSHALVQEDDIQISDSARKLVETARNKVAKWLRCYFFTTKGGMTSDPTARKTINNVITREALINCDFSGNVLDEVDQAQVYIRDAIIALAKEIWYCIDSLTNRN